MAYFDSPKNKALWDRELESLDAERARRREEGYKPQIKAAAGPGTREKQTDNPKVRRITLKELEEIERNARAEQKTGSEMSAGASKTRQRQRDKGAKTVSVAI